MNGSAAGDKISLELFAELMVGETVCGLERDEGGLYIRMESGLLAKIKKSYSSNIPKEKIVEFEFQFPISQNVITLGFVSGKKAVILV